GAVLAGGYAAAVAEHPRSAPPRFVTDPAQVRPCRQRWHGRGLPYVDAPLGIELGRDVDRDARQDVLVLFPEAPDSQPVPGDDEPVAPVDVEALLVQPAARPGRLACLLAGKVSRVRKDEAFHVHRVAADGDALGRQGLDKPLVAE